MKQLSKPEVDREKITNMLYDDEALVSEFAEATIQSFREFSQNFTRHLLSRNETDFRKAGHKIKPVAQMIGVEEVIEEYEHAKELLQTDSSDDHLRKSADRVNKMCEHIQKQLFEM